jgi:hypothetical protein
MVEVRYAGVVVGRSAIIRELDPDGLFLGVTEPLPVGTIVTLKVGNDETEGRVEKVSESGDLPKSGMRIGFRDHRGFQLLGGTPPADSRPVVAVAATPAPPSVAALAPPMASSPSPAAAAAAAAAPAAAAPVVSSPAAAAEAVPEPAAADDEPEISEPIPAPLVGFGPPPGHQGGGKRRRRRR